MTHLDLPLMLVRDNRTQPWSLPLRVLTLGMGYEKPFTAWDETGYCHGSFRLATPCSPHHQCISDEDFRSLKVGDVVKICDVKFGGHWSESGCMDEWLGKNMTIREYATGNVFARMVEDCTEENNKRGWCWHFNQIASIVSRASDKHITEEEFATLRVGDKVRLVNIKSLFVSNGEVLTIGEVSGDDAVVHFKGVSLHLSHRNVSEIIKKKMRQMTRDEVLLWACSAEALGWVVRAFEGNQPVPAQAFGYHGILSNYRRARASKTGEYVWQPFEVEVEE